MITKHSLGGSGLDIAPLVLGGNVLGWTADRVSSFAVLDAFVDGGGTMIDTADVYSVWADGHKGGESETVIGEWLKASGKRDDVLLATKVGMLPGAGGEKLAPSRIAAACNESLQRLGTDRIDVYFAHRDDADTPQADVMDAFAKLIEAGKVRAIGASNYDVDRLQSANEAARRNCYPEFTVLQPEYNLVARASFEGDLQRYCIACNLGVVPYFGLAAGFLTGKYRSADDFAKSVRGQRMGTKLDDRGQRILVAMDGVASETGATLPQIALAWLMAQPGVTAPIASARTTEQLAELLPAMTLQLSPEQRSALTEAGA